MSAVPLQILEPANGQNFSGAGNVHLRGGVAPGDAGGLFFKWYSSLAADPLSTVVDFTANLAVGSHVIMFTAKDVAADTKEALQAVQRAGMAGGPAIAQQPCIIHVFIANLVLPDIPGSALSKASATLAAEAPYAWDKPDYQQVNRLRYRWRFAPLGPPAGRPSAELVPLPSTQLSFRAVQNGDPAGTVPQVRYNGPLPPALSTGSYTVTLRVENLQDSAVGHEIARNIVLNP